jgi:hypothetical protein
MGFPQAFCDLEGDVQGFCDLERLPDDSLLEAHPVDKGHGDIHLAVLFLNLIDCANVGMVEGGRGLGLAQEPLLGLGGVCDCSRGRSFRATGRLSFMSSALNTTPMPPRPISLSIRYLFAKSIPFFSAGAGESRVFVAMSESRDPHSLQNRDVSGLSE